MKGTPDWPRSTTRAPAGTQADSNAASRSFSASGSSPRQTGLPANRRSRSTVDGACVECTGSIGTASKQQALFLGGQVALADPRDQAAVEPPKLSRSSCGSSVIDGGVSDMGTS